MLLAGSCMGVLYNLQSDRLLCQRFTLIINWGQAEDIASSIYF